MTRFLRFSSRCKLHFGARSLIKDRILSRQFKSVLPSELPTRYRTPVLAGSRSFHLNRRAGDGAIGTEDAAVALLRLQLSAPTFAVVHVLTSVRRHRLDRLIPTLGARDRGLELNYSIHHHPHPPRFPINLFGPWCRPLPGSQIKRAYQSRGSREFHI
jgi:hypothetical protein